MTVVAVRLPDALVRAVDALVESGRYGTRTEAVRAALSALVDAHERMLVDKAIVEGYMRMPQTDEEVALAATTTRALIEEEPW
jgi:Arc/MetJ-type ribon-helix-helix transcriptional regulator